MKTRKGKPGRPSVGALVALSGLVLPALVLVAPAEAQAPALAMLDQLDNGRWEVRFRDGAPSRMICVRTGREFIQMRHPGGNCNRYVVEDGPSQVTVQYTCPGNGYGLTNVRRESRSLVQIKGSGLADSRAFEFTAEARRMGTCR